MKNGFIKIASATPTIRVADCVFNAESIVSQIKEAEKCGAKLIVFPELCTTGYTCGDLFGHGKLLDSAEKSLCEIAESTGDILAIVGAPVRFSGRLYNCAVALNKGKIIAVIPKTFIQNHGEFYESRHFASGDGVCGVIDICGQKVPFGSKILLECKDLPAFCVGVEICEDLFAYLPPSTFTASAGATVIANCMASAEVSRSSDFLRKAAKVQSAKLLCAYICAGAGEGESTSDSVFGAHSIIAENGSIIAESRFENKILYSDADVEFCISERIRTNPFPNNTDGFERVQFEVEVEETTLTRSFIKYPFLPSECESREEFCEEILTLQALGLKKRVLHTNAKRLVIGVSGGLDSTLALLVCARTMDMLKRSRSDILGVTMPCFGTTKRTKSNAEIIANQLSISFETVDITNAVKQHFRDINHDMENHNVVFENSQARERTQVIMDIANSNGGLVIGTGDLSELALGWATYNGDQMSMYGLNASVPKTLVRYLVEYVADTTDDSILSAALRDILDTPVSPELLPAKDGEIAQKTEDLVGPYELHDFFIYYFVHKSFSAEKIRKIAIKAFDGDFDAETVDKWLGVFMRRFFSQQFKRSCMPDGPKVTPVSLSPRGDWRMPSDAVRFE